MDGGLWVAAVEVEVGAGDAMESADLRGWGLGAGDFVEMAT